MSASVLRRRLHVAVFLIIATAAAACGSTVQLADGQLPSGTATEGSTITLDDGLGMPGPGSGDGTAVVDGSSTGPNSSGTSSTGAGTSGSGSGGTVVAGGDGTAGGTAPTASGSGGTPGTAGGSGEAPGVTADTIKIGLEYASDSKEANSALGEDVSSGDARANAEALIKHYNARGGFAGRKIVPAYYEYSAFQDLAPQQEEACAHYTQDEPVFAVVLLVAQEPYINCLAKAGIGAVAPEGITGMDDGVMSRYPGFALPSALTLTQVARLYGPGLRQAGFFEPEAIDKSTTIGLITFDQPRYHEAAKEFEASLRSVGETLDVTQFVHYARTVNQAGQLSAEVSSAVLRFREEGVDHVTILEESALIALFFQQTAERQGYRPQYGFNSTSGGQAFINSGLSEPGQMTDARLVGWSPQFDVPGRYLEKWPAQQECLRLFREAGLNYPEGSNQRGTAMLDCAAFDFMHAALGLAPGPLSTTSLQAGMERLGTAWESPWNEVTRFGPGRHYGAAQYRTAAYAADCECFKPTGPLRPIP